MRRTTGLLLTALLVLAAALAPPAAAECWRAAEGSYALVVTAKAGLLGAFGHRHAILGEEVEADLCYDAEDPAATRGSFTVATASLVADSERGHELAGLEDRLKPEDVEEVQANMMAADYLAPEEYPQITLEVKEVRADGDGPVRVTADFTLHGTTREIVVPMEVHQEGGELTADGSFTLEQTDYGIKPASVAGVVKVADEVEVRLHLVARPSGEDC